MTEQSYAEPAKPGSLMQFGAASPFALWALALCLSSFTFEIWAITDTAVTAGVQTTHVSTNISGASVEAGSGLSSGVLAFLELSEPDYLRVGAIATERRFSIKSDGRRLAVESVYLEVPVSYFQLVTEKMGWFAGGRIGVKLSEENCNLNGESCPGSDLSPILYGAEAGGHFLFNSAFGIETSYILGLSDISDDVAFNGSVFVTGFYIF
ncbi:MAG: outer membrane beta-barrel protein [Bdellovibrionales bacterium]|nr:outer membrane beta-barrel protein [Bdellovibrionales bacterium]